MKNTKDYQLGLETLAALHGGHAGGNMVHELADISPEFTNIVISVGFGQVASRHDIDFKTRELVTIASCITLGHAMPQLKAHIEAALKVGASKQEIVGVILQISFYAGFAAASNAFRIAKEVFAAQ